MTQPTPDPSGAATPLLAMVRRMRATRSFTTTPVDDASLREILEVARWVGSARNRQPWHWTVCRGEQDRIVLARSGRYAAFLSDAPVVLVLSVDAAIGGADVEFDAGRAAQQLLVAAHAIGLGACPATLEPARSADLRTLLSLRDRWAPRWAIGLGHPAPTPRLGRPAIPAGRRRLDEVVSWR